MPKARRSEPGDRSRRQRVAVAVETDWRRCVCFRFFLRSLLGAGELLGFFPWLWGRRGALGQRTCAGEGGHRHEQHGGNLVLGEDEGVRHGFDSGSDFRGNDARDRTTPGRYRQRRLNGHLHECGRRCLRGVCHQPGGAQNRRQGHAPAGEPLLEELARLGQAAGERALLPAEQAGCLRLTPALQTAEDEGGPTFFW